MLSLPKEVRSSVILNEDNTIDKYSVSDALDKCPASGNLLALYKIVSDEREVSHFLN